MINFSFFLIYLLKIEKCSINIKIYKMIKLDKIDIQILKILQKDATKPLTEISKKIGISKTPCWNRIKKLEENGIILSKVAIIDNKKVNLPLIAFLSISIPNHTQEWLEKFTKIINKYDQIVETHRVAGSSDYILKILIPSMDEYDNFQQDLINETGCINMQTSFSQKEIKNKHNISLEYINSSSI